MGVPTFFRWLCVRYPKIIRDTIEREPVEMDGRMVPVDLDEDAPNGNFDNLYLDMNGIIHPCCHPEDGPAPEDEEHMYENIFLYLDRLIRIVRPKKVVYMAIDGVAPRAKMNQQRARRFRAAQEREEMEREQALLRQDWEAEGRQLPNRQLTKPFDSNVITPGTNFLHKMSEAIRYYIHDRTTNDPLWQKLKFRVVLSDANIPSEGEHKIMQFIRLQRGQPDYDPNIRHCLYGADADLIMLGLATHEAHFSIIREVVIPRKETKKLDEDASEDEEPTIQKPFQLLSIPILRQYMMLQFGELQDLMPESNPYDFERCVDDFVFMCFFVGNDFLPHLPSLNIRDGSIDQMVALYVEILPTLDTYLTDCGKLNLPQVESFLEYLGGIEDQVFKSRLEQEAKRRAMQEREFAGVSLADEGGSKMGGDLREPPTKKAKSVEGQITTAGTDTANHLAQSLANSFSMDLDNMDAIAEEVKQEQETKKLSGKFVDKQFFQTLKDRLKNREDLGVAMPDTVRLGEGPHWKQRYYFEKFKVKQEDLVDFLQRIRKAYCEGLCWVLVYYYQGCGSWTWFYPYHYAPFASDLIGCSTLKCSDVNYFQYGAPFLPFQQLMSVLPPASSEEAGIPGPMRELMKQPFSPLIDFYPADFGLDLNGKRFTWQAVILLPFIDEPRLVRILGPLLKQLKPSEKVRNRRGQELVFGHKHDKTLFHAVQLAQAAYEAGQVGKKQKLSDNWFGGFVEGWQSGGAGRTIVSPIEGLPDVDESNCMSAQFTEPEAGAHVSKILPGAYEQGIVVNASDMDDNARMKGFGGEPARRMIMQALGKDAFRKPVYKDLSKMMQAGSEAKPDKVENAKTEVVQPFRDVGAWADTQIHDMDDILDAYDSPAISRPALAPPPGTKVIRIQGKRARS